MRRLFVSTVLPLVVRWVAAQERRILAEGCVLDESGMADARGIGVAQPERIRLLRVEEVPLPGGAWAARLGGWLGAPAGQTNGLTARYGIYIRADAWGDRRLIAHELVHTAQYERMGSVRRFLRQYLTQCLRAGYAGAALEREAVEVAARVVKSTEAGLFEGGC